MPLLIEPELSSPTRMTKKTARILVVSAAAVLLGAGTTAWTIHSHGYETTDAAQVDGHLNVESSRITGTIETVQVTDNQAVEVGQSLVDLDPSEQKVAYAQAKAQYNQAVAQLHSQRPNIAITEADNAASGITSNAQLAEAGAAVAAASQDLAGASATLIEAETARSRDSAQLQRYEQLFQAGTISRQDYERLVASARSSEAEVSAAKANVESAEKVVEERRAEVDTQAAKRDQIARTAPGQLANCQADLATSEANVEVAPAQLQRSSQSELLPNRLAGPGIVTQRTTEIGNRLSDGQPLMMIVATGDTWITANFKETQLSRMRAGQRATVHIDAPKRPGRHSH